MKKQFILLFCAMLTLTLHAQNFRSGNFKFSVLKSGNKEVELTGTLQGGSGPLEIPSQVDYDGETYTVVSIGSYAFNSNNYTSLKLPNTIRTIGDYAFMYCAKLRGNLVIPNSVTTIGAGAFEKCTGLNSVTLSNNLKKISGGAFYNCTGLSGTLIIPDGVESIGNVAFQSCDGISKLILGAGLKEIGNEAFLYCNLKGELIIPNTVVSIGTRAFEGNSITSLKLSDSLQAIQSKTFYECKNLTGELVIPASVKEIGVEAFLYAGIQTLVFKSSPQLNLNSFGSCHRLTEVKCYGANSPFTDKSMTMYQAFEGSSNFVLAVPKGRLAAYSKIWGIATRNIFDELPAVQ